jgi:hypothetical protein
MLAEDFFERQKVSSWVMTSAGIVVVADAERNTPYWRAFKLFLEQLRDDLWRICESTTTECRQYESRTICLCSSIDDGSNFGLHQFAISRLSVLILIREPRVTQGSTRYQADAERVLVS